MFTSLNKHVQRLQFRLVSLCNHPRFDWLIAVLFFSEAIFFPIPVDPLLVFACLNRPKKSYYYGLIATISSVMGGVVAYGIGALVWRSLGIQLIHAISSEDAFNSVCRQLTIYESWAVLIAGFTPFPYKVMALATGFCQVPFGPFVFFSILSRAARFMLITSLVQRYGTKVQYYLDRYGTILLLLFMLISFVSFSCLK